MGNFIKLFENHKKYDAFVSLNGINRPNVSHCVKENEVHYNPVDLIFNGHEYVDLGLPSGTLWAKNALPMKYQWGSTAASQSSPCQFMGDSGYTKYNEDDGLVFLESSDDAASVNMGGKWHLPNRSQIEELIENTELVSSKTQFSSVTLVSKINGNEIVLPSENDTSWNHYLSNEVASYYTNKYTLHIERRDDRNEECELEALYRCSETDQVVMCNAIGVVGDINEIIHINGELEGNSIDGEESEFIVELKSPIEDEIVSMEMIVEDVTTSNVSTNDNKIFIGTFDNPISFNGLSISLKITTNNETLNFTGYLSGYK